jgi:hypothetical protein
MWVLFRVEIEPMGHGKTHTFCGDDAAFFSGKPHRVKWKPSCRDNSPDPGKSFLGAFLNADPVGNAKYVFNQVYIFIIKLIKAGRQLYNLVGPHATGMLTVLATDLALKSSSKTAKIPVWADLIHPFSGESTYI